jgi:hypothetical protein
MHPTFAILGVTDVAHPSKGRALTFPLYDLCAFAGNLRLIFENSRTLDTGQNRLRKRAGSLHRYQETTATAAKCRNPTRSGRRVHHALFPGTLGHGTKVRRMGQNTPISTYDGTAGKERLTPADTTINCPTRVSHFRDGWDTLVGQKRLRVRTLGSLFVGLGTSQSLHSEHTWDNSFLHHVGQRDKGG